MKRVFATAAAAGATAAIYARFFRSKIMHWGATPEEAAATLPGDELIEHADGMSTRAITIDAAPSAIWPWMVQIGPAPRGGIYTYDWIENLLGLNMHSSDEILEEFQHPQLGDEIGFGPNKVRIARIEDERALVWQTTDENWTWSFVLEPSAGGSTRLISRNRFRLPKLTDKIGMAPMEPASLVMERKMLLGFKQRAERLARERAAR